LICVKNRITSPYKSIADIIKYELFIPYGSLSDTTIFSLLIY